MSPSLLPVTYKYVIDTCSLTAMRRIYPEEVFPGAWAKLDDLADIGVLASSGQVYEELKSQDDGILEWAKLHSELFLPLDEEVQESAATILREHASLLDLKRNKSSADPFVIATAMVNSCAVVTEERPSGGPEKEKIPDVCRAYGIECIPVLEMFRIEGLRL